MPQLSRDLQNQIIKSSDDPNFQLWTVADVLVPEDNLLYYKLNNDLRQYSAIEEDPILGRLCEERRESPSLREVKVYAGGSSPLDELAAEIVRKTIDRINFDHLCSRLNHAIFTGRSFAELIWGSANLTLHIEDSDIERECYIPVKVEPKDPARLIFGAAKDDRKTQHYMGFEARQTTLNNWVQGDPLPLRKVIIHSYGSLSSNPFGKGCYRRLYWLNHFKKEVLKLGLINSDGRPVPAISYDRSATPQEIRDAEGMLADFYKNSWILLPDSFKISFASNFVQGQVQSLKDFLTWFDTQASMSILGATLTSQADNTATRGDSSVHYKVTEARAKSDSDLLSESIKEFFVKPIVELNCAGAALPGVYRDFTPEVDKKKEAEVDRLLFDLGYRPTPDRIREIYGEGYLAIEQWQKEVMGEEIEEDDSKTTDAEIEDSIDPDETEEEDDEADLQESAEFGWIIKRKLNFDYDGYQFSVGLEYLPGDIRFAQTRHARKLRSGYGHIRNHTGSDRESLDAYIAPDLLKPDADRTLSVIWAIEQILPDGTEDELKLILGAATAKDAIDLYLREMPQNRLGGVRRVLVDELKGMRRSGVEATKDEDTDEFAEGNPFYLVWAVGRNTCTVVRASDRSSAIAAFRKTKAAGHDGKIAKARKATEEEAKQIRKGVWLRVRADGSTNTNSGSYKYRPQLKNKAKGRKFNYEEGEDSIEWCEMDFPVNHTDHTDRPLTKGSIVTWKYGTGTATGKVIRVYKKSITLNLQGSNITRNGTEENPAVLIKQENGSEVLKLMSEVNKKDSSDRTDHAEPIALPNNDSNQLLSDDEFDRLAVVTETDVLAAIEPILEGLD